MAIDEGSIPVGTTGKLLRTFEETTTEGVVHVEALSIVDPENVNGVAKVTNAAPDPADYGMVVRFPYALGLDETLQQIRDRAQVALNSADVEYTHVPFTVTDAGDTVVYNPAAGKAVRIHRITALNDPSAATPPLISVFLGIDEKYRGYVITGRQRVTGPVDGNLIFNLSAAGNVSGTVLLEEI